MHWVSAGNVTDSAGSFRNQRITLIVHFKICIETEARINHYNRKTPDFHIPNAACSYVTSMSSALRLTVRSQSPRCGYVSRACGRSVSGTFSLHCSCLQMYFMSFTYRGRQRTRCRREGRVSKGKKFLQLGFSLFFLFFCIWTHMWKSLLIYDSNHMGQNAFHRPRWVRFWEIWLWQLALTLCKKNNFRAGKQSVNILY